MKPSDQTPILRYSPMSVQTGPLQLLAYYFALANLYTQYGRIPEFLPGTHLALLVGLPALLFTAFSGGIGRVASSRVALLLILFTAWAALGIPFSVWRGGSFSVFVFKWGLAFASFLMVVAAVVTLRQCRRAMYTLGAAAATVAILTSIYGSTFTRRGDSGRLGLWGGTLRNSNDLAAMLLMGTPFCMFMVFDDGPRWRKAIGLAAVLLIVPVVFRTGSRAGMLGLLVVFGAYFFQASFANKVKLAAIFSVLAVVGIGLSAETALQRFTVLRYDAQTAYGTEAEISAALSAESRWRMLKESLILSIRNPVLGVGIGQFQVGSTRYATEEGQTAAWRETHNAWTQLSSETGIPGLLFYGAAFLICLRSANSLRKTARQRGLALLHHMALCLWLSLIGTAVVITFSSLAYNVFVPIVLGIAASVIPAARAELNTPDATFAPAARVAA